MTRETFLLLIRHALTVVGVILTQLKLTNDAEWAPLADAITTGAGGVFIAAALAWSIIKARKRKQLEAEAEKLKAATASVTTTAAVLLIACCTLGCSTVSMQDRETGFIVNRVSNAFSKSGVGKFKISIDKDGTRTIEMTSYSQESADTWSGMVQAFAAGFKTGMEAYQGRTQPVP